MRPIINNLTSNLTNQLIFSGGVTPEPPAPSERTVLLEFDDLASIVATGNNVTQVNDKSGNGNNFTVLSTPKINGFTQNSLNVIDLVEGDNSALVSGTIDMTNSFTFYFAAKVKTVNSGNDTLINITDNLGQRINLVAQDTDKFNCSVFSNVFPAIVPSGAPYEQNYMIYKFELDHINNTATLSIDGNQVGQVAYTGTMGTTATINLGKNAGSDYLECSLAEFMFYEGIVNPVDDAALISFFKNKWTILDPRNFAGTVGYYMGSNPNGVILGSPLGGGFELESLIDLSGNANNLDSTPIYRPIAFSPANRKNGLNAVEFDNIQKSMKALNFPVNNLDSSMTFVFVTNVIPVGITNSNQSVISWNQFPNDFNIEAGAAGVFNCRADGSSTFHSNLTPTGTPYSGAFHVFIYKLDGIAGTASLIIDNVFRGQVNDYTGSLTQGDFYLNANKADRTQGLIQNFLELLVISRATTTAEDTELFNFYNGKCNL